MSVQSVDLIRDEEKEKQRVKVRTAAIDQAWAVWDKAIDRAQRDYAQATNVAGKARQETIDQGRGAFLVAINKAWKDYQEAK